VFLFAGGLFVLTAKTYAEGAAMFPEAGGSSSFARRARELEAQRALAPA
jgi:APA family basic amino acid/polyamine antiporter